MSPRHRRLLADGTEMRRLEAAWPDVITMRTTGEPPEQYGVSFRGIGLERVDGRVRPRREHAFTIALGALYPRRAPLVTWASPIFHPNILGPEREGAVCLDRWSSSDGLADLCRHLIDMASYRQFTVEHALDPEAAAWVLRIGLQPGGDLHAAAT
jgi:ubiquitin-protein ligase